MAILKTRYAEARNFTCVAGTGGVTGGRLVKLEVGDALAAKAKVIHTTAAADFPIGAAEHDALAGEEVSVCTRGIQWLEAAGAVVAGAGVSPAAGGLADDAAGTRYGQALGAATGAGQLIPVLVGK